MSGIKNRVEKLERSRGSEENFPRVIVVNGVLPKHQEPPEGIRIVGYRTFASGGNMIHGKNMSWSIREGETESECLDRAVDDMAAVGINKPYIVTTVHNDEV